MDRLLDETRTGAFYLRQPAVADMIVEAIQYNASILDIMSCTPSCHAEPRSFADHSGCWHCPS